MHAAQYNPVPVIGVGASAGGLEAVSQFLSGLTPDLKYCLVVLQHLSPNYKSMMTELLARETRLVVEELKNKAVPKAGVVYVVPPNTNAVFKDGVLCLSSAAADISPKPSINEFFISLAAEQREAAVGIILSGTGSDGTAGLRAIRNAGGLTIAQLPQSAKYAGMPFAAIEESVVDHVLDPQEIAQKLMQLPLPEHFEEAPVSESALERLLSLLKLHNNIDFSGYKAGTLSRRIRRRMVATGHQNMEGYLSWLETNTGELDLLSKDILISVTSFFRDPDSFATLDEHLDKVFESLKPDDEIRLWVAGCATGEEAYSLAILVQEKMIQRGQRHPVQIFATDIDEHALHIARQGLYPQGSLSNISEALKDKYFIPHEDQYEANKALRDMIVFAKHNVLSDPPFLRLNLVSCRNVMIYFDNPLQARVLQRFHFALRNEGCLFLGRSESVAQAEQLFAPLNRRERLFQKQGDSSPMVATPNTSKLAPVPRLRTESPQVLLDAVTEQLSATVALCTSEGKVIQTSGAVSKFFKFPSGSSEMMISDVIASAFQSELMAMLHQLKKTQTNQQGHPTQFAGNTWQLSLSYTKNTPDSRVLVLILPSEQEPVKNANPDISGVFADELQVTREQLQSLIEELATANEEMQSLNEEAQASNEELQATNEELEAANEELQATNEELVSLNEELSVKTTELILLNEEYSHLYDSLDYPVLVFDRQLTLVRFNAPASMNFNLKMHATNVHVSRLKFPDYMSDLEASLQQVMSHGDKQETLIEEQGKAFQLIITPGLDSSGEVQFLVVNLVDITDARNTKQQLDETENRLKTIMENTTVLISMKDLSGKYLYANETFLNTFKIDADRYEMQNDYDLLPVNLASQVWAGDLNAIRDLSVVESEHNVLIHEEVHIFKSRHQVLTDSRGKPNLLLNELEDITTRKQAEEKLKIAARVFQQAGEAIVVTDKDSKIMSVNQAFSEITGYSEAEAIGQSIGHLLNSGRHSSAFFQDMWHALDTRGHWQGEIWNKRKNREVFPEWLTVNRIKNDQGETEYFIAVFSDITNLKESQRKVEFLATHDALTGLPNRNLFIDRLENAVARCKRSQSKIAVMFIDLDNFKSINDTLGHDVGDKLLVQVAKRLQHLIRDIDTVSRLGGDEFTIVVSDCDPQEVQYIASRILDELSEAIEVEKRKIFASASIGISIFPEDGADSTSLLKSADTAMYKAKESGRNQYQFFHSDMRDKLLKQSALESSIKNAIRQNQFRLVYQPKFSAPDTSKVVGAEALLRWYAPNIGNISPAEFIPVAEQNGSIIELSQLVVRMLVEQVARWLNQGVNVPEIAFNVSAKSFQQENFVAQITSIMDEYLVPYRYFKVEITEGTVMETTPTAMKNLDLLREAGISISIDDFGTGYSSLNYLKQLPISELKIDKSFVDGLTMDDNDEAISTAILSISKALGLQVVAEGVETNEQLSWLQKQGCDLIQGYLLAKPMEAVDFEKLLIINA